MGSGQRYQRAQTNPGTQSQSQRNWRRSGENSYSRNGSSTRTSAQGEQRTRSYEGQGQWQRSQGEASSTDQGTRTDAQGQTSNVDRERSWKKTGPGTYEKSGSQTVTGPQGQERTRSYEGSGSVQKTDSGVSKTYEGTRTNAKGETSKVNRENSFQKTGDGTYERSGSQTVTGPNGQERTSSYEGSGSVQKTDSGFSKTYEGTRTNAKGETVDVNRSKEVTKSDGSVTVEKSHSVTDSSGQTLHSDSTTTTRSESGVSKTYEGTHTNKNGDTTTVNRDWYGTGTTYPAATEKQAAPQSPEEDKQVESEI